MFPALKSFKPRQYRLAQRCSAAGFQSEALGRVVEINSGKTVQRPDKMCARSKSNRPDLLHELMRGVISHQPKDGQEDEQTWNGCEYSVVGQSSNVSAQLRWVDPREARR